MPELKVAGVRYRDASYCYESDGGRRSCEDRRGLQRIRGFSSGGRVVGPRRSPKLPCGSVVTRRPAFVFVLELMNGESFVTQWSAIPAQISSGHHWITILTAMFMHGSWSHIIGNMIFLWAFAPETEDAMGRGALSCFLLTRRIGGHAGPGRG